MILTDQQIEELVISELKNYYNVLDHAVEDEGWYSTTRERDNDRVTLAAIINLLTHYLTKEDHDKWLSTIRQVTQK
jgi:hypothetical protein|tara:strand:+ start:634 stop:861 length:228 start_codon:yes stop_codon:yes gene_type:complete